MRVHGELGQGFLEITYQNALAMEFESRGIPFEREVPIAIWYLGRRVGGNYRADFRTHGELIVELKALPSLGRTEAAQLAHYLAATGSKVGLLLNFGARSLQFQRVIPRPSSVVGPDADARNSDSPILVPKRWNGDA